jgi:very-short-patch-repair endonuclease
MAMLDAGLPVPTLQIEVWADGLLVGRLDMGYEILKVGVEYDGADHHSSPAQRQHDSERRERMTSLGWTIVVVRKEDLSADRRGVWIGEVRERITARERSPYRLS